LPADLPLATRCSFDNTSDKTISFGLHTSDEMCIVLLYYWPATEQPGFADLRQLTP